MNLLARAAANLMYRTFTGQSIEEYEAEQMRSRILSVLNRHIELRMAKHGYVFSSCREALKFLEEIINNNQHPEARQRFLQDDELSRLLILYQEISGRKAGGDRQ